MCIPGVKHFYKFVLFDTLMQVEKATMTDGLLPEPVRVRPKERGGRWGHASPFMRGSTIVRSQTFSPGARSQYVCRVRNILTDILIVHCSQYVRRVELNIMILNINNFLLLPFSYIAATVTARLYQRKHLLSEIHWKEEL